MAEMGCPYCFQPMLRKPDGWYVCQNCGHTIMTLDLQYQCRCRNCEKLNAA